MICGALLSFAALASLGAQRPDSFRPAAAIHRQFAIADFDGDQLPDFATVQIGRMSGSAARYFIQIELSKGPVQTVSLIAPLGGLEIIPRDVNGDQALDLVVSTQWLKGPVAVLLNDGHGNFKITDPAIYASGVLGHSFHWKIAVEEIRDCAALPLFGTGQGQVEGSDKLPWACESSELITGKETRRHAGSGSSNRFGRSPPFAIV